MRSCGNWVAGAGFRMADAAELGRADVAALAQRHASWDWRFGATPAFDAVLNSNLGGGPLSLLLHVVGGRVNNALLESTDPAVRATATEVERGLFGAPFSAAELSARISGLGTGLPGEMANWLAQAGF